MCCFLGHAPWQRHMPKFVSSFRISRWIYAQQEGGERKDDVQALCDLGDLEKAVEVMRRRTFMLPEGTYWSLLNLCNKTKSLQHVKYVHDHMCIHSLSSIGTVNEYLVLTLVKCGDLEAAITVFHKLHHRTVYSWTAVISGYVDHGRGNVALQLYHRMLDEGLHANEYTYICIFKACSSVLNLSKGKVLHACALKDGLPLSDHVGSAIVAMYHTCGSIDDAEKAFFGSSEHDVVSWTMLLSAYIEHGLVQKAIFWYNQMPIEGVNPNEWTISAGLQGCCILSGQQQASVVEGGYGQLTPLEIGHMLHLDACLRGLDIQVLVGNNLLRMYGKCRCILEAEHVFGMLPNHDVVSWTAMLCTCVEQGEAERAFRVYRQMMESGVKPDKLTFVVTLQACFLIAATDGMLHRDVKKLAFEIGQGLHADARRERLYFDSFVGNAVVHLYVQCAKHVEAEDVFAGLGQPDVVSWTVMLPVYVDQGNTSRALQLYQHMQKEGVSPDERTLANVLQACCKLVDDVNLRIEEVGLDRQVALDVGRALHGDAVERGFEHNVCVCSLLVNFYGKCGGVWEAEYAFSGLSQPDIIAYNAMLSVYVEGVHGEKALQLHNVMLSKGIPIDDMINGSLMQLCMKLGDLESCKHIHHSILWMTEDISPSLATGLIHTYASCASLMDAQAVHKSLPAVDVVPWNALIAGLVQGGDSVRAFKSFDEMQMASARPNAVTFLSLLSACCEASLVDKGLEYFEAMSRAHNLALGIEHYGCILDLLGRAGYFAMVEDVLSRMPMQPDVAIWLGLLGACRVHTNVELGRQSYDHAVHLQPQQAAAYVMMADIYVDAGMLDQAGRIESFRLKACAWKRPAESFILINNEVHSFVVREKKSFLFHALQKLQMLLKLYGHIPLTDH